MIRHLRWHLALLIAGVFTMSAGADIRGALGFAGAILLAWAAGEWYER